MKNGRHFLLLCPRCNTPILEGNTLILPRDGPDHHIPETQEEMTSGQLDRFAAGWFRSLCAEIERMEQNCPYCRGMDKLDY